jgi:UDP-2,3-diacylglucosamine hydrolase
VPLKRTLFVSDLHLDEARPETTADFERFLREIAPGADALYVLGDLFEYWVGDDGLALPFNARIGSDLAQVAKSLPVRFMHGNRDFLIAERFARETGVGLLEDPTVIDLYGERVLLMHGDTLCTDDKPYQAFRAQVRNPAWQRAALARPLEERVAMAQKLRIDSESAKDGKTADIMDVAPETVEKAFAESGCRVMIHGHTHRPARHVHRVNGRECVRWVLGDWYGRASYLEATPEGIAARILGNADRV